MTLKDTIPKAFGFESATQGYCEYRISNKEFRKKDVWIPVYVDPCPLPTTCWGKLLHAGIRDSDSDRFFYIKSGRLSVIYIKTIVSFEAN
jgi:hypothetical protein